MNFKDYGGTSWIVELPGFMVTEFGIPGPTMFGGLLGPESGVLPALVESTESSKNDIMI